MTEEILDECLLDPEYIEVVGDTEEVYDEKEEDVQ